MVTGVLFLMLFLLALLLAAFIYEIVTTPLTAVDAPTVARAAAAEAAAAAALPVSLPRPRTRHAGTRPPRTTAPGAARGLRSSSTAVLAIAGLAAVTMGGWLFLRIAHGAAACSPHAIEICSQGYVLLTGVQLAGAAIAVAGIICVIIATIVVALR